MAAANEIASSLLNATGATLPVVSERRAAEPATKPTLFLGNTTAAAKLKRPPLPLEGYSVAVTALPRTNDSVAAADPGSDPPSPVDITEPNAPNAGAAAASPPLAGFVLGDDGCNASWPSSITDNSGCRRGTLFGAHALLRHLGFDWLWPGEAGAVVPVGLAAAGVTLPAGLSLADAPELVVRRYRPVYGNPGLIALYAGKAPWLVPQPVLASLARDESQWLTKAGMGSHGAPTWGAAFSGWWDEWGSNGTLGHHPEWFALLLGNTSVNPTPAPRRGPWAHDGRLETKGVKMCVSNTGLQQHVASGWSPGLPGVSACEDDGDQGYCTCDKCRAWDAPGQGPESHCHDGDPNWPKHVGNCRGQYSDRYARFWDTVAGLLAKQQPANPPLVTGYAYDNYESPPVNYTIKNGNVMVGVVAFDAFPPSPNSTISGRAAWLGWRGKGAQRMFWRPNVPPTFGVGPYEYGGAMAATLAWLAPRGLRAVDVDSLFGHWALTGVSYFATARGMWHPGKVDHAADLDAYCTTAFGARAAPACVRYVTFWEAWTNATFGGAADDGGGDGANGDGGGGGDGGSGSAGGAGAGRAGANSDSNDGDTNLGCSVGVGGPGDPKTAAVAYTDDVLSDASGLLAEVRGNCTPGDAGCAARVSFWADGLEHARLTAAATRAANASSPCAPDRTCDLRNGSLASSLQLLAFRRRIAASSPVNVLAVTVQEMEYGDTAGVGRAAEIEPLLGAVPGMTPELRLNTDDWVFAFDPDNVGLNAPVPWYSMQENTKNKTKWLRVSVGESWNATGQPGAAWAGRNGGRPYTGVAWYRVAFQLPPALANATQLALVARVNGSATAWLNGKLLRRITAGARGPNGRHDGGAADRRGRAGTSGGVDVETHVAPSLGDGGRVDVSSGLAVWDLTLAATWAPPSVYQRAAVRVDDAGAAPGQAGVVSVALVLSKGV